MASIWNDIEITWQDEEYKVKPNLELINYLERKPGRSISQMVLRMSQNDLPSGAACELISDIINYAGGKVTAEDVFAETGGIGINVLNLADTILVALMPPPKEGTYPEGDGKKKTQRSTTK